MRTFDISVEIFPPNTAEGLENLNIKCFQLAKLQPKFFSVTFGAAGSAQSKTQQTVQHLLTHKLPTVPHISGVNMTASRLLAMLQQYMEWGVKQLVVVRGDIQANSTESSFVDFKFANEIINFVREKTGDYFHITTAAYPEFHPQAINPHTDLENFKRKVVAGANSAITQYFFNSDAFFRFIDSCEKLNINIPIIPGILPITDYHKLRRFSHICGAEIPLWLSKRLEYHAHDSAYVRDFGIDIITELCEKLISGGVKQIHFYTLNQVAPVNLILENLNLDKKLIQYKRDDKVSFESNYVSV